ncbi:conserved hypothetical protein [Histoplasma capsulatum var. duboisii H88]|nr:conserved hypothetical protein [Histoplasma capsulatum var. duboisii H88]
MYSNILYVLLLVVLIVLNTLAFYYPLRICTAFLLALEDMVFCPPHLVAYEKLVKCTAVVVSIDYMVLAGLLLWRGIRGIPSQGSIICEVAIHAILIIITAGFAAGGLVHNWPLWIEGDYRRDLRYDELTACSDGKAALQSYQLGFRVSFPFLPLSLPRKASTSQKRQTDIKAKDSSTISPELIRYSLPAWPGEGTDRKLRKRTSTLEIQNAEPNKRTNRSQDQDDDQIATHDLLNEIRGKSKEGYVQKAVRQRLRLYCCGCEEDVSGGGECRQCGHTSCPECLHERRLRREISVDRSHKPNQVNRCHDAQTSNQTRAVPATLSQAIKID